MVGQAGALESSDWIESGAAAFPVFCTSVMLAKSNAIIFLLKISDEDQM